MFKMVLSERVNRRWRRALRHEKWYIRCAWHAGEHWRRRLLLQEAAFTLAPAMKEPRPSPSP